MAQYQLTASTFVIRTMDGANIPNDSSNRDRVEYNAWLAAGNTPDPYVAPPPTTAELREKSFVDDIDRQDLITKLKNSTLAQIKSYITTNITDLASARVLLMKLLMVLAITVTK